MEPLAILLVLLSAGVHALRDFFTKKSGDTRIFMWAFSVVGIMLFFPPFLYFLLRHGIPSGIGLYLLLVTPFIHFTYWYFLTRAYEEGDLSHVYPIVRSAPAFILLFSIVILNDPISLQGGLGVLLVVCGAYLVNMKRITWKELTEPIRAKDPATGYALLTLITVTAYSIADSRGVQYVHPMVYLFVMDIVAMVPYTFFVFSTRSASDVWSCMTTYPRSILITAIFGLGGYGLMLFAYQLAQVSYVVGLRQISIVFAILLGGHMLKEKHKSIRLTAGLIIFVGAFLIAGAT